MVAAFKRLFLKDKVQLTLSMDFKTVNRKPLKKIFFNFLIICLLITVGSFVLYNAGVQLFAGSDWVIRLKNAFLLGMIGIAMGFSFFQAGQKRKLQALPSVEEKIKFYEIFYRNRLWWQVLSCLVSGFLLLLTHRTIFLFFCLFDLLMMAAAFPSELIIKKELNEDELLFVDND